ncbi:hypothetical protein [Luteolibacter marinus]|uniref:hypothetical protein n=1 Tax=Luteolibacter marinus TaxID=2776705 RepID=UPI001866E853|nr:hypothetical protein [Luteolibacter marinus]
MKRPLFKVPLLGSLHVLGYWVTLLVLMFGSVAFLLHYIFLVVMAVPVVGAFEREPRAIWRGFSIVTVSVGAGYLLLQFLRFGNAGILFHDALGPYGLPGLRINFIDVLVVSMIFLPLSFACAVDRLRQNLNRGEQGDVPKS